MKRFLSILSVAMAASAAAPAALANNVTLYASGSAESIQSIVTGFQQKHSDIKVNVVRAGTGSLMQRIKAESANPQADIFMDGGLGTLATFKDNFEPYVSPEAKNYPKEMIGDDNRFLGVVALVHSFLVNKKALKGAPVPQTWAELLKPEWKGKVIMGNPEQSSSSYAQIWAMHKYFGKPAFDSLAQISSAASTSAAVSSGVSRGEFPVAVTLEYLAQDYVQNGAKDLVIVYPKDGTLVSYTAVGIIKGAKNRDNAHKLYDYIASREGRERVLKDNFLRPARADVDMKKSALPELKGQKLLVIDEDQAAKDHAALLAAWKQLKAN